ncbi:glycosyltransferase [Streptomyces olivaceus]|uniref:Glycosyltransferase n=1 Tax=Streptomyces olivaceus TaxID=47716 RepID=A0ABS7WE73_STROV|nr:glycosyltransferase [Streptomyces olivaceus]MBZ6100567.1 glycosyltransferase [Streptomyces olivaceus]MBZ6121668.1 glycosyltransferase [Streptomyces olivaceus]MBZ6156239.1 glycosyltransferase [Streptomyces olivaceus]MBZ6302891.1 glycosyltransferase [Streptomyces olivaceus]
MPVISIITPVYDGGHQYLSEAYASLTRQTLPAHWSWEWVLQEDGRSRRPLGALPDDQRVRYAAGKRGGAGVARTLGLARARGTIVRALDADDLLTDGALQRDIEELARHPSAGWCVSGALDLLPDGSLVAGPYDPPAGPLSYESLREAYEADRFPVVGTHLAARTDLVRAVGGWPALPALEALALVLVCAAVAPGRMLDTPGGVYRKHGEQTTAHPEYWHEAEFSTMRAAILSRLDSLQRSQWRWTPHPSEDH